MPHALYVVNVVATMHYATFNAIATYLHLTFNATISKPSLTDREYMVSETSVLRSEFGATSEATAPPIAALCIRWMIIGEAYYREMIDNNIDATMHDIYIQCHIKQQQCKCHSYVPDIQ